MNPLFPKIFQDFPPSSCCYPRFLCLFAMNLMTRYNLHTHTLSLSVTSDYEKERKKKKQERPPRGLEVEERKEKENSLSLYHFKKQPS